MWVFMRGGAASITFTGKVLEAAAAYCVESGTDILPTLDFVFRERQDPPQKWRHERVIPPRSTVQYGRRRRRNRIWRNRRK